jgi:hypothetical protein
VLVYVCTLGFVLSYPAARQLIKKDYEPKDRSWAWAKTTVIAAPALLVTSIIMVLRYFMP